jgi:hypothetical protein
MEDQDWLTLLRLGMAGAGAAGGAGAFSAGAAPAAAAAIPTGATMSGADLGAPLLAGGLTVPNPPDFGGQGIPGVAAPYGPPPPPPAPQRNLGLPTPPTPTPPPLLAPNQVDQIRATMPPPGSPAATPQMPLTAEAVNAVTSSSDPRSWWQRNISDPWDKANVVDPKTGMSPAQKALAGVGSTAGSAATAASRSAAQPSAPAGSPYRPTPINAAQMALTREQQLELLRRRAHINTPWLNRLEQRQQGLMG